MKRLNTNRKEYSIKNLEFKYDKLNNLLYLYKKDSSVYSNIVVGEFHLELSKEGAIVGVEILKASEILAEYKISAKLLENIEKVEMRVVTRNNSLLVFLMLRGLNQEKSATITMNNLESPIMHALASA